MVWLTMKRLRRLRMSDFCFNVVLQLGSSGSLQAFSQLTLPSRRVFRNLNVDTILFSRKESPGLLPHRFGCRRKFQSSFNRCVVWLHLELSRQAHQSDPWTIAASIYPSGFATCSTWWVHGPIVSVGTPMDCLWDQTRVCSRAVVKSKASNAAHATLSRSLGSWTQ